MSKLSKIANIEISYGFHFLVNCCLIMMQSHVPFFDEGTNFLNAETTVDEVTRSISILSWGKSSGNYGLSAVLIKSSSLYILFTKIFSCGHFSTIGARVPVFPLKKQVLNITRVIIGELLQLYTKTSQIYFINDYTGGLKIIMKLTEPRLNSAIDNLFSVQAMAQKYLSKSGSRFHSLYLLTK